MKDVRKYVKECDLCQKMKKWNRGTSREVNNK